MESPNVVNRRWGSRVILGERECDPALRFLDRFNISWRVNAYLFPGTDTDSEKRP